MATAKKTVAKKAAAKKTPSAMDKPEVKKAAETAKAAIKDTVKDVAAADVKKIKKVADKLSGDKKPAAKKAAPMKKSATAPMKPAAKKVAESKTQKKDPGISMAPAPTGLTPSSKPVVATHAQHKDVAGNVAKTVTTPAPPAAPVAAPAPKEPFKPVRPLVTPPRFAPKPPPPPPAPPAPAPKPAVSFAEETKPETKRVNVKKFPLVPLFGDSTLSQNNFSRAVPISVNMPDGSTQQVKSGFLAFNKSIELLALTSSNEWLEAQHVTTNDHIGDDLKLLAICAELDGQNVNIQVNPEEHVFRPAVGNAAFSVINTEISYSPDPTATPRRIFIIKVEGNVDLQTGRAYLSAICTKPELAPTGFFLQGSRQSYVN